MLPSSSPETYVPISPLPASVQSLVILQVQCTCGGGTLGHPKAPGSPDNGPLSCPPHPLFPRWPPLLALSGAVCEVSVQICPAVWHSGLPPRTEP